MRRFNKVLGSAPMSIRPRRPATSASNQLVRQTGLSAPTVNAALADLEQMDILRKLQVASGEEFSVAGARLSLALSRIVCVSSITMNHIRRAALLEWVGESLGVRG